MDREVLDRWCERGILALVLAILAFGPLALGAVRGIDFAIIVGLTVGAAILWAARLWLDPRPQLLWPPICWSVLAFTAYAIGRYCTADIEYGARHEVLRVLVYAVLFFAILNNLHRQESTQIISFTLVFLALAIAGYAVYQFLVDSRYVWRFPSLYPHRGSGTYINPNHLGGFLEMLLPLALAYTLVGRLKPVTRILLGYAALVILAGIGVTISRGSWFSTCLSLLLFFAAMMFQRNYRLPALVLLVVLVGAGALYLPKNFFVQRRLQLLVTQTGKVNDDLRFALWGPAWRMWRENPWWGVGPAHFDARFRAYRPEEVQMTPQRVHNDYLNTLADWGAAGAVLVASAWLLLAWGVARTWRCVGRSSSDLGGKPLSNKFAFLLGASLGLVAILAHSAFDFNMHIPANALLCITLMALLSSQLRFATDKYWHRLRWWARSLATLGLLAAGSCLAREGWRQGAEFVWLRRAAGAPSFSVAQIGFLKRAFSVEPMNAQTAFALGEAFRHQSQEGGEFYEGQQDINYRKLAEQAMNWYGRGTKLNPWDSRNFGGYGWCLDWLDRSSEATAYFDKAEALDPNNYFNLNNIGLHYMQTGNYAAARPWFERSLRLQSQDNSIAENYLAIANERLLEAATNDISARLMAPRP